MTPPSNPSSVYLDSNALIYLLQGGPGHGDVLHALALAMDGKLNLYISTLSYVEVRGYGNDEPYPAERDKIATELLDSPSLTLVEFSRGVALKARKIAHTYRLKNPDAIHIASALYAEAEVLFTADQQLKSRGLIEGVHITEPYLIG
ncbi:type II toxin-antitoxin system VapC family toxin [Thermopolyspora sp. NPDC052614]|uniref:type II toxin-antitoxin system VapC family toxin n=1 Tax=Thermopolyspora sp. NPDC052614 TaxID=3155682 RepID=UPI0034487CCC